MKDGIHPDGYVARRTHTNADRIRSMTDEELAVNMMCPNENGLAEIDCDKNDNCNCYECRLPRLLTQQGLTTIERVNNAG